MSSANTFGSHFSWSTFGESHGTALGVVIDGCPAGVKWDESLLQTQMERRRPGQIDKSSQQNLVTERKETDTVEVLSGVFEGKTLGTPIACVVYNQDQKSQDYDKIKNNPRIGHADDMWKNKFGHSDYRGGGRASARETVARVIAGSVAEMFVTQTQNQVKVCSFVSQVGKIKMSPADYAQWETLSLQKNAVDTFAARFPTAQSATVVDMLMDAKIKGESYGGVVETWITDLPVGLGEPVFDKLKARLAYAMMSIGATCSFEIGEGKDSVSLAGSLFHTTMDSKNYGGIRGGISTGEPVVFKIGFKPPSTLGTNAKEGRHDPCVLPRAVPIVEGMAWTVIADLMLQARSNRL